MCSKHTHLRGEQRSFSHLARRLLDDGALSRRLPSFLNAEPETRGPAKAMVMTRPHPWWKLVSLSYSTLIVFLFSLFFFLLFFSKFHSLPNDKFNFFPSFSEIISEIQLFSGKIKDWSDCHAEDAHDMKNQLFLFSYLKKIILGRERSSWYWK